MSRRYSQRSLNNLKGIHPDLRRVIDRALKDSPLDFIVIEGLRTKERQQQLVAAGASRTMNSRHITGHAVDLLPLGPSGPEFAWPLYNKLGPAVEAAADAEGVKVVWGGRWAKFRDGPHFELDRTVYPPSAWTTGDPAPAKYTSPVVDVAPPAPPAPPAPTWFARLLSAFLTKKGS
jgi:peptidoglycan LD-endopeptidase CwlK